MALDTVCYAHEVFTNDVDNVDLLWLFLVNQDLLKFNVPFAQVLDESKQKE
jgi:hypothetical protein